jgi:hypothetical protein
MLVTEAHAVVLIDHAVALSWERPSGRRPALILAAQR